VGRGLDARRCLAYHTTATRAPIPERLRTRLGRRLYGCDECQQACPWNAPDRPRDTPVHPDLRGTGTVPLADLHRWLGLSGRALKRELAGTAMDWLSRVAVARTLCVVLGNLGRAESRDVLRQVAETDPDPVVREHARWALGRIPPTGG
jgi:epoxyqueuosine reductase